MEYSIRDAIPSDVTALSALLVEIHDLHVNALPGTFTPIETDDQTEAFLASQLATSESQVFVAEHSSEIVGYIWVRVLESPQIHLFVERRIAEIDTLVVAAARRRQGIGEALVARAQDWAIAYGADEMRLVVYAFNQDAIRFYDRLGYAISRYTMTRPLETDR